MGLIGRLVDFITRSRGGQQYGEATARSIGDTTLTAQHFGAPGEDARPLPGDSVIMVQGPTSGSRAAVGYAAAGEQRQAAAGERRTFARNAQGETVSQIWQYADGRVVITNQGGGAISMTPGGEVTINGVRITTAGDVVSASGISLNRHRHAGVQAGPSSTLPPTPGA